MKTNYRFANLRGCQSLLSRVMMLGASLLLATLAHGAGKPTVKDEPPPEKVKFELKDVRHQMLPFGVRRVFVGPDDRVWLQLGMTFKVAEVAQVKAEVECEFHETAPQLITTWPVLFEKSGRVWFPARDMTILLGYDGKTWIESPTLGKGEKFVGCCQDHGPPYRQWFVLEYPKPGYVSRFADCPQYNIGNNLDYSGRQFFSTTGGVECFDGKKWISLKFETSSSEIDAKRIF